MLALTSNPSLLLTGMFAVLLLASTLLKLWLYQRQIVHVVRHRAAVPAEFATAISLPAHQKAADYTVAKCRVAWVDTMLSVVVVVGWTLLGGLDALNQALLAWMGPGLWQQVVLVLSFVVIGAALDLPLSLYQTFVIETRFGFNRQTWRSWLVDAVKSLLLGAALGLPLLGAILWAMGSLGPSWWLWAWVLWAGFNLALLVIYPLFLAPLFNRFEPLQDESLKARVTTLMRRCGFTAQGLYVMDGSRRSAHANAYFTGFGASKRVVFYDTLLAKLTHDEVEAVLAHELGHFHHKHVLRRMILMFAFSLLGFALLGLLSQQLWFYTGLGVRPNVMLDPALGALAPNDALALLLFLLVAPAFTFWLSPWFAALSRKDEFQADAYARQHTQGTDLAQALLKLYEDNASTLTPDPWFVRVYHSHPPAQQRLARLREPAQT